MKKIIEVLVKARKEKGLSDEDMFRLTKMHPDTLRAFEDGTIENRMHPLYVKGFIRSYAKGVGLDPEDVVAEFEKYVNKKNPEKKDSLSEAFKEKTVEESLQIPVISWKEILKKITDNSKPILIFASSIFIIIFSVFVVSKTIGWIKSSLKERPVRKYVKINVAKDNDIQKTKKIANKQDKSKKTSIQDQNNSKTSTSRGASEQNYSPSHAKASSGIIQKVFSKSKSVSLLIETTDDVWMKVKADDEVIFHDILPEGKKELWKAKEKINLWVGKAEAIRLTLNGDKMGKPGDGVIKNIEVRSDGIYINGSLSKSRP